MTYERFEQLPAWEAGIEIGRLVFLLRLTKEVVGIKVNCLLPQIQKVFI